MSIVKMKRLRLFGMRSDREELLKLLQHMGCVEIDEPVDKLSDPDWEGLARPDGLAPVSYTHLDVYKRQVLTEGISVERAQAIPAKTTMATRR